MYTTLPQLSRHLSDQVVDTELCSGLPFGQTGNTLRCLHLIHVATHLIQIAHTHTHTHTHIQTNTHTHTNKHTHTRSRMIDTTGGFLRIQDNFSVRMILIIKMIKIIKMTVFNRMIKVM